MPEGSWYAFWTSILPSKPPTSARTPGQAPLSGRYTHIYPVPTESWNLWICTV